MTTMILKSATLSGFVRGIGSAFNVLMAAIEAGAAARARTTPSTEALTALGIKPNQWPTLR